MRRIVYLAFFVFASECWDKPAQINPSYGHWDDQDHSLPSTIDKPEVSALDRASPLFVAGRLIAPSLEWQAHALYFSRQAYNLNSSCLVLAGNHPPLFVMR